MTAMLTEYLFEILDPPNGARIKVLRPEGAFGYEGWIVRMIAVGIRVSGEEFPATKVSRYRDGGTTYITCSAGMIYSPARGRKDKGGPEWRPIGGDSMSLKDISPRTVRAETGAIQELRRLFDKAHASADDPVIHTWARRYALDEGSTSERVIRLNQRLRETGVFAANPLDIETLLNPTTIFGDGPWLGDANDVALALGAAVLALGYKMRFVGQAFPPGNQICHVCIQVWDEHLNRWIEFDPLYTDKPEPTKTIVIDRPSENVK